MRRILSILLVVLLLYNMIGYSVVYMFEDRNMVGNHAKDLVEQQAGSENITIKVPVAVPYQNNWDAPEPVEGKLEFDGQFYQMKSRQLVNDTLYVKCEFDQNARDRFMELVAKINDQVTSHSKSEKQVPSSVLKSFLKEYMSPDRRYTFYLLEWVDSIQSHMPQSNAPLPEQYQTIPSPPPNSAC